jgi:hypothetical protein
MLAMVLNDDTGILDECSGSERKHCEQSTICNVPQGNSCSLHARVCTPVTQVVV